MAFNPPTHGQANWDVPLNESLQALSARVDAVESGSLQGTTGIQGHFGTQGVQGLRGHTGTGLQGTQGVQGTTGIQGAVGAQGPHGEVGAMGAQGLSGRFTVSDTPPADGAVGDSWYDSTTGQTYVKYDGFWVETGSVVSAGGVDPATPTVAGVVYGLTEYWDTSGGSVALGNHALEMMDTSSTASDNVAIGSNSGGTITSGYSNVLVGTAAGYELTDAHGNVAVGETAMSGRTAGVDNVAVGIYAHTAFDSGVDKDGGTLNTVLGPYAGKNTSGSGNVLIGASAGELSAAGDNRLIIANSATTTPLIGGTFDPAGGAAGEVIITGTLSVNDGTTTSEVITKADHATPTVEGIVYATTDNWDTSNGVAGFGYKALNAAVSNVNEVAIGPLAALNKTSGGSNVMVGTFAAGSTTNGSNNVLVGESTMAAASSIGSSNVAVGYSAGHDASGDRNVFIGNRAGHTLGSGNDRLVISNSDTVTPLIGGTFDPAGGAAGQVTITGTLNVNDGTSTHQVATLDTTGKVQSSQLPMRGMIANLDAPASVDPGGTETVILSVYLPPNTLVRSGSLLSFVQAFAYVNPDYTTGAGRVIVRVGPSSSVLSNPLASADYNLTIASAFTEVRMDMWMNSGSQFVTETYVNGSPIVNYSSSTINVTVGNYMSISFRPIAGGLGLGCQRARIEVK